MKITSALVLLFILSTNALAAYNQTPFAVTKGGTGTTTSTGSGSVVLSTSPTLVTPALGTPSALVGTNITGTASGLTAGNVTTNANLTGAVTSTGNATSLGSFSSANLSGAVSDETGSGAAVFATSPVFTTPNIGSATGSVSGNAGTATALQTARTINGVSFDGTANITITAAQANMNVVDGGDAAYSILAANNVVRTSTTLTANRAYTLPLCTGSNIGEKHYVKNLPAQTFNIVLTAAGSDLIDGSATTTLLPGDSATVICGAFSTDGTWDLN